MSTSSSVLSVLATLSLSAVLLCPFQAIADEQEQQENDAPKPQVHIIGEDAATDGFPLVSVGGSSCLQLKLYDMEKRKLNVSLKNISKNSVKIKVVLRGCPCLTLAAPIKNVVLGPGQSLPVDFTIDAKNLKPGAFDRFFYVDIEGYDSPARLPVKGEVTELFKFSPNKVIQLGTFIGDVPWTRTFTLESLAGPDKVSIKPPEDNPLFNVEVQKESPTLFKVKVSPKGELPAKRLKEVIELTVEGIPNYGPAELGLMGIVTGWSLVLENEDIVLKSKDINHEEPVTVEAKLILRSEKFAKKSRRQQSGSEKKDNPLITVQTVADNEEKKAHPLSSPETWQPLLKDIMVERLPENVKLEKIPSDGCIILKFTLPAGFFKSSAPSLYVPVKYKNKSLSSLSITAR